MAAPLHRIINRAASGRPQRPAVGAALSDGHGKAANRQQPNALVVNLAIVTLLCCSMSALLQPSLVQAKSAVHASKRSEGTPANADAATPKSKQILLYDGFYAAHRHFVEYNFDFGMCAVRNCVVTGDRALVNSSDAVWLHQVDDGRFREVEQLRRTGGNPDQYWVWMTAEVVHPGGPTHHLLKDLFNVSSTFRLDSDVPFKYGEYRARAAPMDEQRWTAATLESFSRRSRLAAWAVSHCETASRREDYVRELVGSMELDVYGDCGGWGSRPEPSHAHLSRLIQDNYKFYLAFENAFCRDYITEKMWIQALLNGAIPVVRGGASKDDYLAVAPPGSFIDTRDFATPADLAAHLKRVAADLDLFSSYHAWRKDYELVLVSQVSWHESKEMESHTMCRLCEFLHSHDPRKERRYLDVETFMKGNQCLLKSDVKDFAAARGK